MKRLTTFLSVLCISIVQAQSFDHIVYKQAVCPIYKQVLQKRVFKESIDELNAVKKKYGMLFGEDYLLMSYCYKEMGSDSLSAIYAKKSCSVPTFDMRTTWYIADLNYGYITEGFIERDRKLIDEGFEISSKNYQEKNPDSLVAVIDSMTYWDQFYLNQWYANPDNNAFKHQLDSINSVNEQLLAEMIQKTGFPGEKRLQLGEFCIWVILVHSAGNEEFYQRMKPVFLNEVKIGNMSPWMFANWVDQHQFYSKLPTIYNTQVGLKADYTDSELKIISENRFEIGLVDVEYSLPKF
ncbi:hypothetical protein [Fluviicola taffensis]|uniref:Uncharacterized protein n=1 Tax=Fluviicola taffensis (strain DSM 16823 / NCIMB 13979 / RW262) TaxID=755732 RepID=F2IE69_FLUTR|nr:hypothetical protein [Fluviicola taffensis]AEA42387.1 hypothetical protein Fluta_0379 [Fluviicola taffensis DSM 16823]